MPHPSLPARARTAVALAAAAVLGATGLVATVAGPASAATDDDVLSTGERLLEGDRLVSPSGRYALEIRDEALLLVERASRFSPEAVLGLSSNVGSVLLQADGNLVVFGTSGGVVDSFGTAGSGATAVRLQDDRNLVFFGAAGRVVADAGTYRSDYLEVEETMLPGDVVVGEGGTTRLIMQLDGNLVLYRGTTPLWDSRTGGNPGAGAVMQGDGNLVVYSEGLRPLFSTGTGADYAFLRIEDTEVSVTSYTEQGVEYSLWSSNSVPLPSNRPGAVVATGDELDPGESRAIGGCRLTMQVDGNLVEYCATGLGLRVLFSSGGVAPGAADEAVSAVAIMQADGNFVVYRTVFGEITGAAFATGTSGAGNTLVLQNDRNVVVYGPGGRARWSVATGPL